MQHSGSVDMNPDIFEIEFVKKKKKTRTNRNKNERMKKMSGFTGFGWTEGRYNENMRFQKHPDSSGRSFREGCQ